MDNAIIFYQHQQLNLFQIFVAPNFNQYSKTESVPELWVPFTKAILSTLSYSPETNEARQRMQVTRQHVLNAEFKWWWWWISRNYCQISVGRGWGSQNL